MAHTSCPNGHSMWNGDGKPCVYAYRINYFRDFARKYPDSVLGDPDGDFYQIYDCFDDYPEEDIDGWYCDECRGLTIFTGESYVGTGYKIIENISDIDKEELLGWEEYVAMRNDEFERFQEFYEGKTPLKALEAFEFKYKYLVSPDKNNIYAFDNNGKCCFGYYKCKISEK